MAGSLTLRNPHSVEAALRLRPKEVFKVSVPPGLSAQNAWGTVEELARAERIRVDILSARGGHDKSGEGRSGAGGEAQLKERVPVALEELFASAAEEGEYGIWLALDSLQDPQNVGAIFRSASFFGVRGMILTSERSSPMTATVYDVAAGGVETVPFVLQANLTQALEKAKESDIWVLGTSEHAETPLAEIHRDRHWLIVLGNEEKGMRRLTEETCDMVTQIPPAPNGVSSLNVSVAAGVLMHYFARS